MNVIVAVAKRTSEESIHKEKKRIILHAIEIRVYRLLFFNTITTENKYAHNRPSHYCILSRMFFFSSINAHQSECMDAKLLIYYSLFRLTFTILGESFTM
jgi:hypothetical protein